MWQREDYENEKFKNIWKIKVNNRYMEIDDITNNQATNYFVTKTMIIKI